MSLKPPYDEKNIDSGKVHLIRAILLALYFFTIIAAYYFLKPLSRSLYITYAGSENLPYVWIATTLVLSILIPLYQWKISRLNPLRQIVTLIISLTILLTYFRYELDAPHLYSAFCFYILIDVYSVLLVENFWSMVNSAYKADSGKKWYGIIASGGMLGGLFGGAATSQLIKYCNFTPLDLILLAILVFILALFIAAFIFCKNYLPELDRAIDKSSFQFKAVFQQLLSSQYLRWLACILLAAQLIEPIVEYQLMSMVETNILLESERTKYVSEIFAWTSTFGLFVNIILLPVILYFFGLTAGLLLQPVLIGIFSCIFLFTQSFLSVSILKVIDRGLSYSSGRASRELLYIKYDRQTIYAMKAWIDVYGYRLFRILGSLLLLLINYLTSTANQIIILSVLTIIIVLTWGYIVKNISNNQ